MPRRTASPPGPGKAKTSGFRTLIRARGTLPGVVTDGKTVQPVARIHPHNANRRFIVGNRFVAKADA